MVPCDCTALEKALLHLAETVDLNSDAEISLKEWIAAFQAIDYKKNGVISRKQWQLHQGETYVFDAIANKRHLALLSLSEWVQTFESADFDEDGSISLYEWNTAAVKSNELFNLDVPHGHAYGSPGLIVKAMEFGRALEEHRAWRKSMITVPTSVPPAVPEKATPRITAKVSAT